MMTSFTRIIIVFGLLRNALGTPSAPPNQVLLGLALFLTFFIMSPVIDKIYVDAYQPFSEQKISMQEALDKGAQPLRAFMLRQTREADWRCLPVWPIVVRYRDRKQYRCVSSCPLMSPAN